MKRFSALLVILSLLLCSCASFPSADGAITFRDASDQTIALPARPKRVAVLFSSLAELWQLAGGEVAITIGESIERGFCPADTPLADLGAGKTINKEALLTYQPDFILGSVDIPAHREAAEFFNNAGIPCALVRLECFEDYLENLKLFTDITGDAEAFETYGLTLKQEIDALRRAPQGAQPKILFIRSGSKASTAKAKTGEMHFAAAMLEELGAYNIADHAPLLIDGLSLEAILQEDPDHIFISTMGDEQAAKAYMESLFSQDTWQALTAVKSGNYTYLPKDLFQYKPNARWAEAYRTLSSILYSEQP